MVAVTEPVLTIDDVTFRYGKQTALDRVAFVLPRGRRMGLLGPNGSGKSTLMKLIVGLLAPTEGTVRFLGERPTALRSATRRRLGVAFQRPSLDVKLTVRENLRCFAAVLGLSKSERDRRIAAQLDAFGIADRADSPVGALSGGLQRRADLARAMLADVDLLVLDEPTTGLDPLARREFWSVLDRRLSASGAAAIVATHLFDEAERLDEVVCLRRGQILARGEPGRLVGALPESILRLKASDAAAVAETLRTRYGLAATAVGDEVLCVARDVVAMVPRLVSELDGRVGEITVRKPSLEDAFFATLGENARSEVMA
jgi:ABC-2 type transport system ATP-binding protein